MKNKYRESISKIHVSEELERKILNITVNNEKKVKKIPRFAYALAIMLMVCVVSVGVVFAEEVKIFFTNVSMHFGLGGKNEYNFGIINAVDINQNVKRCEFSDECEPIKINELEKTFGIDILTSKKATNDMLVGYNTGLSNGKIGRVILWFGDFVDYSKENSKINELDKCFDKMRDVIGPNASYNEYNLPERCGSSEEEWQKLERQRKYVAVHVDFLTPYADNGFIAAFESGVFIMDSEDIKEKYYIKVLDVEANIFIENYEEYGYTTIKAIFIYKDMLYHFTGNNISEEEFKEILDSLK